MQRIGLALMDQASLIFKNAIQQIWTIQSFSQELNIRQKYINFASAIRKERRKSIELFALIFALTEGFVYTLLGASYRYGCYLIEQDALDPLAFFRLYLVIVFCMISFANSASFIPDYSKAKLAFAEVVDLIEGEGIIEIKRLSQTNQTFLMDDTIKFDKVAFHYSGSRFPLLHECSFEIPAGKTFVICNGLGKTSILHLILRFYNVVDGKILADGVDIQTMELSDLRENIGYVPQDLNLFKDSIFQNIAYGYRKTVDETELTAKVVEAVKAADLEQFVSKLPDGYDTIVDDDAPGFSRVIRLKIAFARALIRNPKILLLDEPIQELNVDDELDILRLIRNIKNGRTCIITTKLQSLTQEADLIGFLGKSKMEEFGTREELAKNKDSLYNSFIT